MKNKLTASEMRLLIPKLVIALRGCTEYMEDSRCSGDNGNWEWEEDDEYTYAENILEEYDKLVNSK